MNILEHPLLALTSLYPAGHHRRTSQRAPPCQINSNTTMPLLGLTHIPPCQMQTWPMLITPLRYSKSFLETKHPPITNLV